MIRIAHVLCPVDFSEISRRALDHAAALAQWYEARLTVLNVFPVMPVMDVPPLVLDDKAREEITGELKRFTAVCRPPYRSTCEWNTPTRFTKPSSNRLHPAVWICS